MPLGRLPLRVLSTGTKLIASALFLFPFSTVSAQVSTGTVIYVDLSKDEFTIAADSRTTFSSGAHDDTECKILAFGNQFVFTMAGVVENQNWNAHVVARRIWQTESLKESDPVKLAQIVGERWATEMEANYRDASVINNVRLMRTNETQSEVLATAVFLATNDLSEMIVYAISIDYDPKAFTSENLMRTHHDGFVISAPISAVTGGRDEIISEFNSQTSERAREYFKWFIPTISNLPPSQRRALYASKLIELSILLHPKADELGFPIDVLQLRPKSGVSWVSLKPNCARQ
jgi:hypothetical protein